MKVKHSVISWHANFPPNPILIENAVWNRRVPPSQTKLSSVFVSKFRIKSWRQVGVTTFGIFSSARATLRLDKKSSTLRAPPPIARLPIVWPVGTNSRRYKPGLVGKVQLCDKTPFGCSLTGHMRTYSMEELRLILVWTWTPPSVWKVTNRSLVNSVSERKLDPDSVNFTWTRTLNKKMKNWRLGRDGLLLTVFLYKLNILSIGQHQVHRVTTVQS